MRNRWAAAFLMIFASFCLSARTSAAGDTESALTVMDQLRSFSWTIHSDPESLEKQNFVRYLAADTILFAWNADDRNIQQIFSDEQGVMSLLLDQKISNDELKCMMITEEGFAYMVVLSGNEQFGWIDTNDDQRRRIYIAMKQLDPATAADLAEVRGVVKVYRAKERPLFGVPGVEYLLNPFANGH